MQYERDMDRILESISSLSPDVALRTLNRLENRIAKLSDDILKSEVIKSKVDHQKAIDDWLKQNLAGKAEHLRTFPTNIDQSSTGEREYVYTIIDMATYRPPTEVSIGKISITLSGVINADPSLLLQKLLEVRQVTQEKLAWVDSKENFPGFFYYAFVVDVLLPADRIRDLLQNALTTSYDQCVYKGRIRWEEFNHFLPVNWPNLTRFDFKSSAQDHLCDREIKNDFENSAWWWKALVIDEIPDPTQWIVGLRDAGVSLKEIGMIIGGVEEQVNSSSRGERIIKTCQKKLSRRKALQEQINNLNGETH